MKDKQLLGSNARFERASTGSWLTVTVSDLRKIEPEIPEDFHEMDGNMWHAIGLELFPGFDLVTWGNNV